MFSPLNSRVQTQICQTPHFRGFPPLDSPSRPYLLMFIHCTIVRVWIISYTYWRMFLATCSIFVLSPAEYCLVMQRSGFVIGRVPFAEQSLMIGSSSPEALIMSHFVRISSSTCLPYYQAIHLFCCLPIFRKQLHISTISTELHIGIISSFLHTDFAPSKLRQR